MAAEEDLKLDDDAPAAKGGKKKLLLLIVAGVLILLAGAGGAAWFFLQNQAAEEEAAAAEEAAPAVMPVQYVILKPEFVVTFQVGSRSRYLQVHIELMTRQQAIADAVKLHDPMIRNEIIRIIGEQNFERLRTSEGRIELQQRLLEHLAFLLKREAGAEGLEAVLFTNFVMQ